MDHPQKSLNPQQQKALIEIDRPVLILAGAGSGKTKVITHKIAFLLQKLDLNPSNILAVTFTNKAADTMKNRISHLLNLKPSLLPWIKTFHSLSSKILRSVIHLLDGYSNHFTIYDQEDSIKLLKEVIQLYQFPIPSQKLSSIASYISQSKNMLQQPSDLATQSQDYPFQAMIAPIYEAYQNHLLKNNALDFDDLILKVIQIFRKFPHILQKYQDIFQYILVDEFQDTNYPQYLLIKSIAKPKNLISVVGDDDQSIYSWRGSDINHILNFSKDFKNTLTVKLEQNYRSTNFILKSANSVVSHNTKRLSKVLWSNNNHGDKLSFFLAHDDLNEAYWITQQIHSTPPPQNYTDFAILYRMNYQTRPFEEALLKSNIPYKIYGSISFYQRMEIKDLLAYLKIISNPLDAISVQRIINVPKRRIGHSSIQKIIALASQHQIPFFQAAEHCIHQKIIRNPTRNQLTQFLKLLQKYQSQAQKLSISQLLQSILQDIDYLNYLKQNYDHYQDRVQNIQEFKNSIQEYELLENSNLLSFLMDISLKTDPDHSHHSHHHVQLMTVHHSKGLEFNHVFIAGLSEGIFPHHSALDNPSQMEEERRLFYVALTRAKQKCSLSSSQKKLNFGQIKSYPTSRFISEINPQYIHQISTQNNPQYPPQNYPPIPYRPKLHQKTQQNYGKLKSVSVGEILIHPDFGQGKILKIDHNGQFSTVLIAFNTGNRRLILEYSPLQRLNPHHPNP